MSMRVLNPSSNVCDAFPPNKKEAIQKEVTKLLAASFIRDILHPDWLANPVLVHKKDLDEWCMCVDYTDLNKHCPKDPFRLPRLDQIVDSIVGSALLSFLDCYLGYHQIVLRVKNKSKTSFITRSALTATPLCLLGSRTLTPHTSEQFKSA
jgi:hypothetical protein